MEKLGWAQNTISVIVKLKDPHIFSHQKQYPLKPNVKKGLKSTIGNLKEQGLLIPCNSPCNTSILHVKKMLNDKWRLIQDLWIINGTMVFYIPWCLILILYCLKFLNKPSIFQSLIFFSLRDEGHRPQIMLILNHPLPITLRQLRGFLSIPACCHIWIPGYGELAQPLYKLITQDGEHM